MKMTVSMGEKDPGTRKLQRHSWNDHPREKNAASRNLDKREVEDNWDGTYSHNSDYVEGRINKTFVAQLSKGKQAPSRNSTRA